MPTGSPACRTGAADQVFGLIERYQIRCEAVRNGYLRVAGAPREIAGLEHARDIYGRYGLKSRMLDAAETAELSGSPRFHGGWLLEGAGHLNPLGYARGLARAALSQGARIFPDSPVETLERDGGVWRVGTAAGAVRAKNVLLATGAYTLGPPWPKLTSSYFKVAVTGLATGPLDPELRAQVLKGNHSIVSSQGDPVFLSLDRGQPLRHHGQKPGRPRQRSRTHEALHDRENRMALPRVQGPQVGALLVRSA